MKRLGAVISLVMLTVMLACPFTYAAGLSVEGITPKDGETGKQPQNMAVKVKFSENITSPEAQAANEKRFKITDPKGKEQKYFTAYDQDKYPNEIWLILQDNLVSNTEYKITIDKSVASSDGNELGTNYVSTFKTRNVQTDNNISMGMTVGMVIIMVFASSAAAKKMAKQQQQEAIVNKEEALNPYKLAKEKGISVEEAVTFIEKEKKKAEKKIKKKAVSLDDDEDYEDEDLDDGKYHVKAKHTIAAAGFKTPDSIVRKNKKKRAAKKAEEERRLAEMKAKSAGKKKKK